MSHVNEPDPPRESVTRLDWTSCGLHSTGSCGNGPGSPPPGPVGTPDAGQLQVEVVEVRRGPVTARRSAG